MIRRLDNNIMMMTMTLDHCCIHGVTIEIEAIRFLVL